MIAGVTGLLIRWQTSLNGNPNITKPKHTMVKKQEFTREFYNTAVGNMKYIFVDENGDFKVRSITGAAPMWFHPETRNILYYPSIKLSGLKEHVEAFYNQHKAEIGAKAKWSEFYGYHVHTTNLHNAFIAEHNAARDVAGKKISSRADVMYYVKNLGHFAPIKGVTNPRRKTLAQAYDSIYEYLVSENQGLTRDHWENDHELAYPPKVLDVSNLKADGTGASVVSTTGSFKMRHWDDECGNRAIHKVSLEGYEFVVSSTIEGVKNFLKGINKDDDYADSDEFKRIVKQWKLVHEPKTAAIKRRCEELKKKSQPPLTEEERIAKAEATKAKAAATRARTKKANEAAAKRRTSSSASSSAKAAPRRGPPKKPIKATSPCDNVSAPTRGRMSRGSVSSR